MKNVLRNNVLVLNKAWIVVSVFPVQKVIPMLMTDTAVALDVVSENDIRVVKWKDWLELPIREDIDDVIHTPKLTIRVPTVIILANYAKIPKRKLKLNVQGIRARDGNRCQYSGDIIHPSEGNVDHIVPRSKGGTDSWTNCVYARKDINSKKGSKLNSEANLKLIRQPKDPLELLPSAFITASHEDHEIFLKKN